MCNTTDEFTNQRSRKFVTMQLKNFEHWNTVTLEQATWRACNPKVKESCINAIEAITTQRSRNLHDDQWRAYNAAVKEIVARQLENFRTKCQWSWSKSMEELPSQMSKNTAWQLKNFQTLKVKDIGNKASELQPKFQINLNDAIEAFTNRRSSKL